jgi:uncharacterized protein (DUF2235 family)
MVKRIVLCFDGTWNTPDEDTADRISTETNVRLFHDSVTEGTAPDGVEQIRKYYRGVGTNWFGRVTAGALGLGVSRTMMQAFKDLSGLYEDGDQVFILGFSRGAYTARALTGVIARIGLLQPAHAQRAGRPDDPNLGPDDPLLVAYQHWTQRPRDAAERRHLQEAADDFRAAYGRPARVAFLGVWDTVGALGIPGRIFQRFNESLVELADRELSLIVDRAYHAVAVDEHREEYAATLWERRADPRQMMEQCWFAGDHCDVGGGHESRDGAARLADISLAWMQGKARAAGLTLTAAHPDLAACVAEACHDTYSVFLKGLWAAKHPRYFRPIGATPDGHETVHPSVLERRRADARYRPQNPGLPPP